jgi:ribosome-binding factor A
MKRDHKGGRPGRDQGPSQRQLRAGELIRHALVDILREEDFHDPELVNAHVTVTEVRMSPDLRHALCFVEPLGGTHSSEVVKALNRHAKYMRGRLGRGIEMKFTPDLKFVHDPSFDEAARMASLFNRPEVRRDLEPQDDDDGDEG